MEAAHDEDRQRDERRAICASDDVSGRCKLAHVEFDIANHAAERADLRLNGDELRVDALDGNRAVANGRCMRMLGDRELEMDFLGHVTVSLEG